MTPHTEEKSSSSETDNGSSIDNSYIRPVVMGISGKKRLACTNCRKRRKKCDLAYPCSSCSRLKIECNVNEEDLRKKRYTSGYVKSLETHIASLETNLKKLVEKVYPDNEQMLRSMMVNDVLSGDITNESSNDSIKINGNGRSISSLVPTGIHGDSQPHQRQHMLPKIEKKTITLPSLVDMKTSLPPLLFPNGNNSNVDSIRRKPLVKGSFYPEGPVTYRPTKPISVSSLTSVNSLASSDGSVSSHSRDIEETSQRNQQRISDLKTTVIKRPSDPTHANLVNNDPMILKALSKFYRWLYPGHFIFVHRESFLYGFFNDAKDNYASSHYCSIELIYAMCAVGCRLAPELRNMSEVYYEKSKSMLLALVFDENSIARITTVQALFCLAFYELGKGQNQQAWYFSGLAIRVGYDMGFQLDPKVWYTDDAKGQLTTSELEIRSRIYWGCYIADHFISLMLGRTASLSVSNSTIPESNELPEVVGTEEFRFVGKHVLQVSLPLKNLIILSRIVQIFTSKIFIESDDTNSKIKYLNKFNTQVYNWRQSLPEFLQWSQELIKDPDVSIDPTISYFWYYYYIVRLTFNKPFIEDSLESKTVVIEIIADLKTLFDNFNNKFDNFERSTLFQLYACLLVINCLKKLLELKDDKSEAMHNTWTKLADYFSDIFFNKMYPEYLLPKKLYGAEMDTETPLDAQVVNQVNTNYTHDFSLSNEIDDLIKDFFDVAYNPANPLV
ncbi:similar to Saccharomyces cerevisiae YOR337W TEA1 Ty1 enhancer activator required for full levels of Ty enhancer-mediated transcription [Maudiozyma barnettii]|uniref:Similar to Saccharomyces cerevisiae YOR337W TEA1 Ty1 enhancer activator required for full levels of Ty enhancer-mediated transcription n=1 Tax=Maudiozyma barnettii TaxID=61262 RepID=A0A8H2ZHK5_9SACH|nr:Tea1p [Kazachstania barnettii]CAB4254858.1 similar to Saccharomyces cerevisiae YOR337W TEA1 Ty1 enhancer activator required for full levels of Ty enhancer-mediated transcription [Kazachstania barnettii]CAD1783077.1 similar to Saccharomyces cerevisiae YOR337W TEA1 Ty1 enhancer activator required for full levels of Ty enhancer-mediated transcription [Kazachstania barnettii]